MLRQVVRSAAAVTAVAVVGAGVATTHARSRVKGELEEGRSRSSHGTGLIVRAQVLVEQWRCSLGTLVHAEAKASTQQQQQQERGGEGTERDADDHEVEVVNWSGTHTARPAYFVEPASLEEVEAELAKAHAEGRKLRVVGAAISPNGLGLSDEGMLSMANCSRVLWVDPETKRVCVEAGARVADVVEHLRPYGLTLQNFASIREQQIGGFVQAGAHGTGAAIPPVDDQVVEFTLITPAKGTLRVTSESHSELFDLGRVGLGALGVMGQVTLQCVDQHVLTEHTSVLSRKEVREQHMHRLQRNKHVRYMWIPYEDAVVVVECNEADNLASKGAAAGTPEDHPGPTLEQEEFALQPLRTLLCELDPSVSNHRMKAMHFADLRDAILATGPLDVEHIRRCNAAEAEFWRRSQGITSIGTSDQVLGFECGGQQWVNEVCFPAGTLSNPSMADLDFMHDLLQLIEAKEMPAPAPIEQRWARTSTSTMSVAGPGPGRAPASEGGLHAWVGIIMYLCTSDQREREAITLRFSDYRGLVAQHLDAKYGAYVHWAKLEVPSDDKELAHMRQRLRERFPVDRLNHFRRTLDPSGVLSNTFIRAFFDD